MGAAALAHLARRGLSVVGIEQDDVPSERGSSVGETRVIRKAYFEDARYVPLLERAYALWRELEEIAGETLFVRTGCMTLGPPEHAAIRGVLDSVARHRLPHELLDERAVVARFPAFVPSRGDVGVFESDAGYLHVERCTRAHARWAVQLGAELRTHVGVTEVCLDGEVRVTLSDGSLVTAPRAVVAAGPWLASGAAFRELSGDLPLTVERQVQLWFPRSLHSASLAAFIHFVGERAFYGIPTADSVKVCAHHGGEEATPDGLDRALRPDDEARVRTYLRAHLPSLDGSPLRSRVCMYTNTPDQHFIVGRSPRYPNVVFLGGFSGHGYKAAAAVGEIAAQLVVDGKSRFDLGMFDPSRFGVREGVAH
jgi:sarcosine oxidase